MSCDRNAVQLAALKFIVSQPCLTINHRVYHVFLFCHPARRQISFSQSKLIILRGIRLYGNLRYFIESSLKILSNRRVEYSGHLAEVP